MFWGDFFFLLKEGLRRRVAVPLMGSEGWAACSSGCIWSVSSRPVSLLLSIIELSSQPVALKSPSGFSRSEWTKDSYSTPLLLSGDDDP